MAVQILSIRSDGTWENLSARMRRTSQVSLYILVTERFNFFFYLNTFNTTVLFILHTLYLKSFSAIFALNRYMHRGERKSAQLEPLEHVSNIHTNQMLYYNGPLLVSLLDISDMYVFMCLLSHLSLLCVIDQQFCANKLCLYFMLINCPRC